MLNPPLLCFSFLFLFFFLFFFHCLVLFPVRSRIPPCYVPLQHCTRDKNQEKLHSNCTNRGVCKVKREHKSAERSSFYKSCCFFCYYFFSPPPFLAQCYFHHHHHDLSHMNHKTTLYLRLYCWLRPLSLWLAQACCLDLWPWLRWILLVFATFPFLSLLFSSILGAPMSSLMLVPSLLLSALINSTFWILHYSIVLRALASSALAMLFSTFHSAKKKAIRERPPKIKNT